MRRLSRQALCVGAGLALAGCITASEFRSLERDVAQMRQSEGGGATGGQARIAELGAQVEELEREVARLRGEVEEARHLADQAVQQSQTGQTAAAAAGTGAAAGAGGALATTDSAAEVAEYEEAYRLYRATDYRGAAERFNAFLRAYPESQFADNALFWVGECWFKLRDYEKAVLTFDEVAKKYPEGNKVPDARYRQGIALMEIGRRTDDQSAYNAAAREIFEEIVTRYPNSERVPEARRQLEKLGS